MQPMKKLLNCFIMSFFVAHYAFAELGQGLELVSVSTLAKGFVGAQGIAVDSKGRVFIADTAQHHLKIVHADGLVQHATGGGFGYKDGFIFNAKFNAPQDLIVDSHDNLWVADTGNRCLRHIDLSTEIVSTLLSQDAGFVDDEMPLKMDPSSRARLYNPTALAYDAKNDAIFIADSGNGKSYIRRIKLGYLYTFQTISGGIIGNKDGQGNEVAYRYPQALAIQDNNLIIADSSNHLLRSMNLNAPYEVSTITLSAEATENPFLNWGFNNGSSAVARFASPQGIAADEYGNIFVADTFNHCIRRIAKDGMVTTLAGNEEAGFIDGLGPVAKFTAPTALAYKNGKLYVLDSFDGALRVITRFSVRAAVKKLQARFPQKFAVHQAMSRQ